MSEKQFPLPKGKRQMARFAEKAHQMADRPTAPLKKCDDRLPHEAHYFGTGVRKRYCKGLKYNKTDAPRAPHGKRSE